MKYRGFSLEELRESFTYDPVRGIFRSTKTGKVIGSYGSGTSLYLCKRRGHVSVQLRAAPLAWFLYYETVPDGEVWFKDYNVLNLRIDNLFVAKKGSRRTYRQPEVVPLEATSDPNILYNPLRQYYIVKRGKKSASYIAKDFEEAKFIRNEWENDKTIQRWDFFHKNMPYYEGNNYFSAKDALK